MKASAMLLKRLASTLALGVQKARNDTLTLIPVLKDSCGKEKVFKVDEFPIMLESGESMICLVTRIKVAKLSTLIWSIVSYFRMRQRVKGLPGLFEMSLIIRAWNTMFLISLWKDVAAMALFATTVGDLHPRAVYKIRQVGAEVWSGHFELRGTAPNSQTWANALS